MRPICPCARFRWVVPGVRHDCSPRRPPRRGGDRHRVNPQRRANRYGHAALLAQSLDNLAGSAGPLQVDHMPTPGCYYDGIVPPRCDLHTLNNVIFGPTGGLMVVAIDWPIARGDRHGAFSQRSRYSRIQRSSVCRRTACNTRSCGTESKKARISRSIIQFLLQHRSRQTPTACRAERLGR